MKKYLFATLFLGFLSSASFAQGDMHICSLRAAIYEASAGFRDHGQSPQDALDAAGPVTEIPLVDKKNIINAVYFDPAFSNARGAELRRQAIDVCVNGVKQYKPLK